jgi:hypothetical protein
MKRMHGYRQNGVYWVAGPATVPAVAEIIDGFGALAARDIVPPA